MGLEELYIQPGHLTLIQGRNGAGKTSVLAALRDLFSGGHDPELIRKGADQGEVEIVLEDGVTVSKVIRPEKSTLTVRHPQLGKVSKPQQYVNALVNTLSVDPVQFLTQKPKERLATLLEAMPLRITADQIGFLPARVAEDLDLDAHALEVLGQAHKALYDERTGVNKAAKEKRSTATEMARTLPAEPQNGGDWRQAFESARDELARLNVATQRSVAAVKETAAIQRSQIDAELQKKIEELRREADDEKRRADEARDLALADLQALPRTEMIIEFKCIEGWSTVAQWAGVRFADLARAFPPATRSGRPFDVDRPEDAPPYVSMATPDGSYYVGLDAASALHPQTLLAWEHGGAALTLEHGAPLRLVTPVKYGIKSIKRVGTIAWTTQRPADYWAERGYDWFAGL